MGPSNIAFLLFRVVSHLHDYLVGGFNPFEKYQSNWKSSPNSGENKKHLKPPPSYGRKSKTPYKMALQMDIWCFYNSRLLAKQHSRSHLRSAYLHFLVGYLNEHMVCNTAPEKNNMAMEVSPQFLHVFTKVDEVHRHQNRSSGVIWVAGKKTPFHDEKVAVLMVVWKFSMIIRQFIQKKAFMVSQWTAPLGKASKVLHLSCSILRLDHLGFKSSWKDNYIGI